MREARQYLHRDTDTQIEVTEDSMLQAIYKRPRSVSFPQNIVSFSIEKKNESLWNEEERSPFFDHSTFQIMNPGVKSPINGQIMMHKDDGGECLAKALRSLQDQIDSSLVILSPSSTLAGIKT